MKTLPISLAHAENQIWDALVIGTGMGGASVGFALAEAGQKILFCDCGIIRRNENSKTGHYAEVFAGLLKPTPPSQDQRQTLFKNAGRSTQPIKDNSHLVKRFVPFIGSGGGGSSALYGMAMERFFPIDFESWPITYNDLDPFYKKTEAQFNIKGELDPYLNSKTAQLKPPPPLSKPNSDLFNHLHSQHLKPYQLPMACEYVKDCLECSGFLCPPDKNCKNDSYKIYLHPAIEKHGASYLENCFIEKLEADEKQILGARVKINNTHIQIKAKTYIIAAGALETPRLLLKSKSQTWPNGLINESGLVGKYLMRHLIDFYALRLNSAVLPTEHTKQIAFSDLNFKEDRKLGIVQSFGRLAPSETIFAELFDSTPQLFQRFLLFFKPIIYLILNFLFKDRLILASISEDSASIHNTVALDNEENIIIQYTCHSVDLEKQKKLRSELKKIFYPFNFKLMKQADNNKRIAHACGTCRFGNDPEKSVLNKNNQAHNLKNMFIVDSSFFPTSGTKNPSLTIAANGLRVADFILKKESTL